jgi:hypothetical protein
MALPPRSSSPLGPFPSICSPLCFPFAFQRQPQTSTAPTDYEPAASYVYFGIEHYRYQNVNTGVLQDFRYSTEPQLQVRTSRSCRGRRPDLPLMSLTLHSRTSSSLAFAFDANSHGQGHGYDYYSHQHSHSGSLTPSPTPYVPSSYFGLF